MKTPVFACAGLILFVSGALAQIQPPVAMPIAAPPLVQGSDATSLGAPAPQEGADIANRVKLRGYVDFVYENENKHAADTNGFDSSSVDLDFLFDFSPVTAEVHTQTDIDDGLGLEQAFVDYAVNPNFGISFGRQLQLLGFESDEATGLYQTSHAYQHADSNGSGLQRGYNDGIRLNFNAGKFGMAFGLHNGLDGSLKDGGLGLDVQAAYVIMPGLEARIGYSQKEPSGVGEKLDQLNFWVLYQTGSFTGAVEFNDIDNQGADGWSYMVMGNYQFNSSFGFTVRYSQEDYSGPTGLDSYKVSLCPTLTLSDNWSLALEYSFGELDHYVPLAPKTPDDIETLTIESIFSF